MRILDVRTEQHYTRLGQPVPEGRPTAVQILASFPPVSGLVFGSTAGGGSHEVGTLIGQSASSAAQRHWRMLGTRSMSEARAWMLSVMRQQVGFAAAIAHARLRLSRLERIGHSGRIAGRSGAVTAPFLSQTMWERHGRGRSEVAAVARAPWVRAFSRELPGLCVSARAACPCVRAVRLSLVVPGRSDGSCPLSRPDPVRSGLRWCPVRLSVFLWSCLCPGPLLFL